MKTVAFIGTGSLGSEIVRAVCRRTEPSEVCITTRDQKRAAALAEECGCVMSQGGQAAARGAKFIVLGVKDSEVCGVLREIASVLTPEQVIVPMSAGVGAEEIHAALGTQNPVIRALPSLSCEVGRGMMLIVPCGEADGELVDELRDLFSGCGTVGVTDEGHARAAMMLEGCVPAFTYMLIEALTDGAVHAGLDRASAMVWSSHAVAGAAQMALETGRHPAALRDECCIPGGAAIEGVKTLEEHGFRAAVIDAVDELYKRLSRKAEHEKT